MLSDDIQLVWMWVFLWFSSTHCQECFPARLSQNTIGSSAVHKESDLWFCSLSCYSMDFSFQLVCWLNRKKGSEEKDSLFFLFFWCAGTLLLGIIYVDHLQLILILLLVLCIKIWAISLRMLIIVVILSISRLSLLISVADSMLHAFLPTVLLLFATAIDLATLISSLSWTAKNYGGQPCTIINSVGSATDSSPIFSSHSSISIETFFGSMLVPIYRLILITSLTKLGWTMRLPRCSRRLISATPLLCCLEITASIMACFFCGSFLFFRHAFPFVCVVSICLSGLHKLSRQGQIDNKWPFLLMSVPHHVIDRFPVLSLNLEINQNRLITAYDLHATLRHVLFYPSSPPYPTLNPFGKSLLDAIPQNRSCSEAGIWYRYCACLPWTSVDSSAQFISQQSARPYKCFIPVLKFHYFSLMSLVVGSWSCNCRVISLNHYASAWDAWDDTLIKSQIDVFIANRTISWLLTFSLFPSAVEGEDSSCLYWRNHEMRLRETSRITNMIPNERIRSDNKIFNSETVCMK